MRKRRRAPSLFLIALAPVIHALRVALNLRHHAFDHVCGIRRATQRVGKVEATQRERVLQALLQTARGGAVCARPKTRSGAITLLPHHLTNHLPTRISAPRLHHDHLVIELQRN